MLLRKLNGIFPNVNLVAKKRVERLLQQARECASSHRDSVSSDSQTEKSIPLPSHPDIQFRKKDKPEVQTNSMSRSEFEHGQHLSLLSGSYAYVH